MGWDDLAIAPFREKDYSVNVWFITKNENIKLIPSKKVEDMKK